MLAFLGFHPALLLRRPLACGDLVQGAPLRLHPDVGIAGKHGARDAPSDAHDHLIAGARSRVPPPSRWVVPRARLTATTPNARRRRQPGASPTTWRRRRAGGAPVRERGPILASQLPTAWFGVFLGGTLLARCALSLVVTRRP
jgi:hypothetical protein